MRWECPPSLLISFIFLLCLLNHIMFLLCPENYIHMKMCIQYVREHVHNFWCQFVTVLFHVQPLWLLIWFDFLSYETFIEFMETRHKLVVRQIGFSEAVPLALDNLVILADKISEMFRRHKTRSYQNKSPTATKFKATVPKWLNNSPKMTKIKSLEIVELRLPFFYCT